MAKNTICVDFDGTLNTYDGWRGPDSWCPPRPGAIEFLKSLKNRGYSVVIFTTRPADGVWSWLRQYQAEGYVDDVTSTKIPAFVYVDDRSLTFRGDYADMLREIEDFHPYWHRSRRRSSS